MIGVTPAGFGLLLLTVATAAGVSAGLIVLLRPLLVRYAMARPNFRSSHIEPTPQGGGIAVMAAALGVAALVFVIAGSPSALSGFAPVFGAALLLAGVGVVDDIRAL